MRWLGGRGGRRRNNSIDAVLCDTKQRIKNRVWSGMLQRKLMYIATEHYTMHKS